MHPPINFIVKNSPKKAEFLRNIQNIPNKINMQCKERNICHAIQKGSCLLSQHMWIATVTSCCVEQYNTIATTFHTNLNLLKQTTSQWKTTLLFAICT
jgi:hypothetical protein